jgi:excisionase family DNA binding protein
MTGRFLRTRDAACLLDMSCETVLRWHRSEKLPGGRRLGSNVLRFDRDELEAWLEGRTLTDDLTGLNVRSLDDAEEPVGAHEGHEPEPPDA